MKLIIDIPDMIYNILNGNSSWKGLSVDYILHAVKDGTPLEAQPKLDTRERERQLEMEYQHGYDKGWEEGRKSLEQQPCEDCISRQAVRKLICQNNDYYGYSERFHEFTEKCLQLPPVTPQTVTEFADKCKECGKIQNELFEDAVSRSEAIKKFNEVAYPIVHGRNSHDKGMTLTGIEQVMNELSAVQIQMKRGFWKEKHYANYPTWHECSICGFEAYEENGDEHLSNFCPNCGAALKEGENS